MLANRRQPDRRCGQVARDSSLRGLQRDRVPIARRSEKRVFGFVTVGSGLALGIPLSQFERGASGIYAIGGCCAILTFLRLEANRSKRCSIGTLRSCFLNWRCVTRASRANPTNMATSRSSSRRHRRIEAFDNPDVPTIAFAAHAARHAVIF
jgi:hypothetical protein